MHENLEQRIVLLAPLAWDDCPEFEQQARAVADGLDAAGLKDVWDAFDRFDTPFDVLDGFRPEEGRTVCRRAAWKSSWQIALTEILYRSRERALPVLLPVAFSGDSLASLATFSLRFHECLAQAQQTARDTGRGEGAP